MDNFVIEELQMEVKKLTAKMEISNILLEECSPHVRSELLRTVAVRLVRSVATIPGDNYLEVPKTWWDAFKLRFFPKWVEDRFPVKYELYEAKWYLPNINLPYGYRQHSVFRWEKVKAEYENWDS